MKPLFMPPKIEPVGVPDDELTIFRNVKKDLKRGWITSNKWDKIFGLHLSPLGFGRS